MLKSNVSRYREPQVSECYIVVSLMVGQFSIEHTFGNRKNAFGCVVEDLPIYRYARDAFEKQGPLAFCRSKILQSCVRHALRIMEHGRCNRIGFWISRQRLVDDSVPFSKAHHHMRAH